MPKSAIAHDPQGNIDGKALVAAAKGWKGVEGTYNFDDNGDGLRGYNIVKNEAGKVKFVEHIDFNK